MAIQRDANGMVGLDADQVIRTTAGITNDGQLAQKVMTVGGNLVPEVYDTIELTYINAGPGTGEIGTVVYKLDAATITTLTLSYDISNRLTSVVKS